MTQPRPTPTVARTVLVVEDDPTINQALTDRLTAEGYAVARAVDGPSALTAFRESNPDLVLLDLMLPGLDGLEVCRRIQAHRPVPVLMLTAKVDETDVLVGLAAGADDYVTKPFRMREVVARVQALLRRVDRAAELAREAAEGDGAGARSVVELGDLRLDRGARRVTVAGREVHLTPLEFDLLVMLAEAPGTVRSREKLMTEVWGWADARGTRTLDSHVKSLRAKIGSDRIRTVHGVGYAVEVAP